MKADISFLKSLRKELHFLDKEQKNVFISEYKTKITERSQKGEDLSTIIGSFEPPKIIAQKLYVKKVYNDDRYNIKNVETIAPTEINLFTILLAIPQFLLLIGSLILLISSVGLGIGAIGAFVLSWLNFNPLQAIGLSILIIGLLPLIGFSLFWIGKKLLTNEISYFKTLFKPKAIRPKLKVPMKKWKKIVAITCISIFTIFTLGGGIGTFAGNNTIAGSAISGNLLYKQTETLDLSEFTEEVTEPIKVSYDSLKSFSLYDMTIIKDWTEESSNLEITRAFNTKQNLKMTFAIEKADDSSLILKINAPWNLLIFNISSNMFTLRYNPDKLDLGV